MSPNSDSWFDSLERDVDYPVTDSKSLTDLSADEARAFFLKHESYFALSLPPYFDFAPILHLRLFAASVRNLDERYRRMSDERIYDADDVAGFLVLVGLKSESMAAEAVPIAEDELTLRIRRQTSEYGELYAIPLGVGLYAADKSHVTSSSVNEGGVLVASPQALKEAYPFKRVEVANRVQSMLATKGVEVEVKPDDVDKARHKEGWQSNADNEFVSNYPGSNRYSHKAIDLLVARCAADVDYFRIAKNQYYRSRRKK